MKRFHLEIAHMRRQFRLHQETAHSPRFSWPQRCKWDNLGRFRKLRARGCGNPKCLLCHYEKVFGLKTHKDLIRIEVFEDSLRDYYEEIGEDDTT